MWELFWQSSRVAVERTGRLAWTPSLDGPRLTGSHLPIPGDASTDNTDDCNPATGAAAAAVARPGRPPAICTAN